MNDSTSKKIVIVEDNVSLADIYKTRLELIGYTCFIAYNGITGLYFIQQEIPDLVLLDLMIPDIPGVQVLETMRNSAWGKTIKTLIISNLNESDVPTDLRQLGIEGYVVKANMVDDQIDQLVNAVFASHNAEPVPQTVWLYERRTLGKTPFATFQYNFSRITQTSCPIV